ncbi:uncharacterized protein LOC111366703 [Olea europaea var. sylvestris]|uniref:uncharacterized protein LOC111366703 n=1 Tax=Olea europaea var. sylvestris TaxID=158386 RepID=UPI000C1D7AE4|nr:uncharacterized protein LOC111366703 [Olea europaea var. sylvestris]
MPQILEHSRSSAYVGHFGFSKTVAKVLQSGFYWPTLFKDAFKIVKRYDRCQCTKNISRMNEMLLNSNVELLEAAALPTNDAKGVIWFLKKYIFTRYDTPLAILNDGTNTSAIGSLSSS